MDRARRSKATSRTISSGSKRVRLPIPSKFKETAMGFGLALWCYKETPPTYFPVNGPPAGCQPITVILSHITIIRSVRQLPSQPLSVCTICLPVCGHGVIVQKPIILICIWYIRYGISYRHSSIKRSRINRQSLILSRRYKEQTFPVLRNTILHRVQYTIREQNFIAYLSKLINQFG